MGRYERKKGLRKSFVLSSLLAPIVIREQFIICRALT